MYVVPVEAGAKQLLGNPGTASPSPRTLAWAGRLYRFPKRVTRRQLQEFATVSAECADAQIRLTNLRTDMEVAGPRAPTPPVGTGKRNLTARLRRSIIPQSRPECRLT